jgi:hypothetical protein
LPASFTRNRVRHFSRYSQRCACAGGTVSRDDVSGRAEEALTYLERASPSTENRYFGQTEWTNACIAALDALQRVYEAQALRLAFFQAH